MRKADEGTPRMRKADEGIVVSSSQNQVKHEMKSNVTSVQIRSEAGHLHITIKSTSNQNYIKFETKEKQNKIE